MLKFLRVYSKWILVVGGSLLMIAWLVPAGVQQMRKGNVDPVVMKVNGQRVRQSELSRAAGELDLLKRFDMVPANKSEHWYLLTKCADDAGYMGGIDDSQAIMDELINAFTTQSMISQNPQYRQIAQYLPNLPEWQTERKKLSDIFPQIISRIGGGNSDAIRMIFAKLAGVARMQQAYTQAPRYSGRRLISDTRNLLDSAKIDFLYIPADAYADQVPDPTEDELKAFYERFKDTPATDAVVEDAKKTPPGGDYGIGYLLPSRVKLVYLTLNRKAVSDAMQPSELDVQKRFLAKFPGGVVPDPTKQSPEKVKEIIREEIRGEMTEKAMKTAQDAVRAEFAKATGKLAAEGDYKKLPEDWASKRPDFAAAAKAVPQRLREVENIIVPTPEVKTLESWQTMRQLNGLPGIGQSYYEQAGKKLAFPVQVLKVREIAGVSESHLQVGVPSADVLVDQQGNRYFYMITGAQKQSNPESYADIREQLVKDYKRLKAYEQLTSRVDELKQKAAGEGLKQVLAEQQEKADEKNPARTLLQISEATLGRSGQLNGRMGRNDPRIDNEHFYDDVMTEAQTLDPSKPVDDAPSAGRTVAMAMPHTLGVVVAVVKAFIPVTKENYLAGQQSLVSNLNSRTAQDLGTENPFTLKKLIERMNVEFTRPMKDDEDGKEIANGKESNSK